MDFAAVRHIAIPEGSVIQIAKDAQPFWRGLPAGYTAVEYIQGNNTAYINTGLYLSDADSVRGRFNLTGASNIFGCFSGSSASDNYSFYTGATRSSKLYARMDGKLDSTGTSVVNEDIEVFMDKTGLWINEDEKATFSDVGEFTATAPFYIGWLANSSSAKIIGKIYEIEVPGKFYGVPAMRDADSAYGLYDYVGHRFLASASSTGFAGGQPI